MAKAQTFSLRELLRETDLFPGRRSAARVEMWVQRHPGLFEHATDSVDWTIKDAMRLVIITRLADIGVMVGTIGDYIADCTRNIYAYKDDETWFVVWCGRGPGVVPPTSHESKGVSIEDLEGKGSAGHTQTDIVRARDLLKFLNAPHRHVAAVINLDRIEREVQDAWKQLKNRQKEAGE